MIDLSVATKAISPPTKDAAEAVSLRMAIDHRPKEFQ
jgi:hypothetical protein